MKMDGRKQVGTDISRYLTTMKSCLVIVVSSDTTEVPGCKSWSRVQTGGKNSPVVRAGAVCKQVVKKVQYSTVVPILISRNF